MEFKPHDYQKQAIAKIINTPRCGLFLDMGLGKTVITLTAINDLLFDYFDINKVLVIAPLKVAESTWGAEVDKWSHLKGIKVSLVLGNLQKRKEALATDAHIYVINRDNVNWITDYLNTDWDFDMVVIDELSSFKSATTVRFKALRKYISRCRRVVGLTGTPSPNSLMDLWSQLYLLDNGERLGKTLTQYRNTYFLPDKRSGNITFSYKLRNGADAEIRDKLTDICMSMTAKDYLTLPDKVCIEHKIKLKNREVYDVLEKDYYFEFVTEQEVTAATKAVLINKLLQISNGAVYIQDGRYEIVHDDKLDKLSEIVEGVLGASILCFYIFKHDLDRILLRFPFAKMLDDTTLREWDAGNIKLLLAHPYSSAYGLNLQHGGNTVVWYGLPWSLELYDQANARLHRQGQIKTVYIHHLLCEGTVDERVLESLQSKRSVQDTLIDQLKYKYREV